MNTEIKILVADDFDMPRYLITKQLAELGQTNVAQAPDGAEALRLSKAANLSGQPFGLVIADWNMPEMSGLDLLKEMQKDPQLKSIPFVMISAESDGASVDKAMKAGATEYIIKPLEIDSLRKRLSKIIAR